MHGPMAAMRLDFGGARRAWTPAAITPATAPRQPAWIAATRPPVRSATRIGTQSATRMPTTAAPPPTSASASSRVLGAELALLAVGMALDLIELRRRKARRLVDELAQMSDGKIRDANVPNAALFLLVDERSPRLDARDFVLRGFWIRRCASGEMKKNHVERDER